MLIGAIVAFCAAVLTFLLIRQRDFVGADTQQPTSLQPSAVAGDSAVAG
jgi:hypothetical protein